MKPWQMMRGFGQAAGGGGGDPYWANVVSLLNFPGADGSTSIIDAKGKTWTAYGNAQIDTSLGYNTGLFDGDGDSVRTPYVKDDFDWWTGDFTIEAWIYVVTLANWYYVDGAFTGTNLIGCANATTSTNYWSFGLSPGGIVRFYYYSGAPNSVDSSAPITTGTLQHIAMSKDSSGIRLAVNGAVETAVAVSGTPLSSTSGVVLTLGQIFNKSIAGHVRALRITKGVARYTSNFTPPSAPFPNS